MNIIEIGGQTLLFYLIPFCVGYLLIRLASYLSRTSSYDQQSAEQLLNIPYFFSTGLIFIFITALIAKYSINQYLNFSFELIFFPIIWLVSIIGLVILILDLVINFKSYKHWILRLGLPFLNVLMLAVGVYVLWSFNSPYPLNWDWYQHQTLSTLIQQGNFSFFTSKMSDTFGFNSYPPSFHLPLALAQYPKQLTPEYLVNFWQTITFWHLVSVGVASWWLGQIITRNKVGAFLSAVIGVLIFDSAISFTNLFFLPQTVTATLFVLLFVKLAWCIRHRRNLPIWQLIVSITSLVLLHYPVGGLSAIIFLGVYVYSRWKFKALDHYLETFPIIPLIIIIAIAGVIFSQYIDLGSLNRGEASLYSYQLSDKQSFIEQTYGYSFYILVILGLAYAIKNSSRIHNLHILILFGFLTILLSRFPYVLKFYTLARFWVHVFMAMGILSLIEPVKLRSVRGLLATTIPITFGLIFIVNIYSWKASLIFNNQYTHISEYDIEAARYIQDLSRNKSSTLISDPSTQFILEGMSGVNSPGGAYMSELNRNKLNQVFEGENKDQIVRILNDIEDPVYLNSESRYLVLSGRTFAWLRADEEQRNAFNFNVWSPVLLTLSDWEIINSFEQNRFLELKYKSDYLVIFDIVSN